ncbi:MAG: hypothetical protein RLY71_3352 [Pseudomonadota bacterium]|jgi:hypothetical protein
MITYEFRPDAAADGLVLSSQSPSRHESSSMQTLPVDEFHVLQSQSPVAVHHRSAQPTQLSSAATRWLHKLPVEVRPIITARRHPHVINRLCALWGDAGLRQGYFQELLFSSRPGRRGFSFEVMDELVDLQTYGLQGRRR